MTTPPERPVTERSAPPDLTRANGEPGPSEGPHLGVDPDGLFPQYCGACGVEVKEPPGGG